MDFEVTKPAYVDVTDGKSYLSFYFSDAGPLEDGMRDFISDVTNPTEKECTILIGSRLSEILDPTIDLYRYTGESDIIIGMADKPKFDAIRAEIKLLLTKLDSIYFVEEDSLDRKSIG